MLDLDGQCANHVADIIDQWVIGRNGERDRLIMKIHLIDGDTIEGLQKKLDNLKDNPIHLSVDRLKKIILKREEQIQRHL